MDQLAFDFTVHVAPDASKPVVYTIYCHTNKVNGKRYVGQTKHSIEWRWSKHVADATSGYGCAYLSAAIRKHGRDAFDHAVLETCASRDAANDAEVKWIAKYRCTDRALGYNLTSGGGAGAIWSDDARARLGASISRSLQRLGHDALSARSRKRAATMGADGLLASHRKGQATLGSEGRRALIRKANDTLGVEGRSERSRKRAQTIGAKALSDTARERDKNMGHERCSARSLKVWENRRAADALCAAFFAAQIIGIVRINLIRADVQAAFDACQRRWATRRAKAAKVLEDARAVEDIHTKDAA